MMSLMDLDKEINDLMYRASEGEATAQEVQFLKNLYHDLWELIPELSKVYAPLAQR